MILRVYTSGVNPPVRNNPCVSTGPCLVVSACVRSSSRFRGTYLVERMGRRITRTVLGWSEAQYWEVERESNLDLSIRKFPVRRWHYSLSVTKTVLSQFEKEKRFKGHRSHKKCFKPPHPSFSTDNGGKISILLTLFPLFSIRHGRQEFDGPV